VNPFERKRMDYFGYWESLFHNTASPHPLIRLACQTIATESCTIVIPPWKRNLERQSPRSLHAADWMTPLPQSSVLDG
jgi:hypothetical protein